MKGEQIVTKWNSNTEVVPTWAALMFHQRAHAEELLPERADLRDAADDAFL